MAATCLLAMWCPVCRRRDSHLGFRTELENLAGDAKGKGTSGTNREAESTDAPERGGLPRSSDEAGVMPAERRGWVTEVGAGQPKPFGGGRSPISRRKAVAFQWWHEPDDARVSSPDLRAARGAIPRADSATTGQVLSCETGPIPRCRSRSVEEKATSAHDVLACMGRTSRSRRPCARGEVLCAEPGRSHPCPD